MGDRTWASWVAPEGVLPATLSVHPRVVDGSGLSRGDQTSPSQVADLLVRLAGKPLGAIVRGDLAVAGRTGTLRLRMRHTAAAGRCQGKTGTLIGASNLVGYCQSPGQHLLAFAIFNDGIATETARTIQDHIVITLASSNTSTIGGEAPAASAASLRS